MLRLRRYRGTLSLVGQFVDDIANRLISTAQVESAAGARAIPTAALANYKRRESSSDGEVHFHITLITAAEFKSVADEVDLHQLQESLLTALQPTISDNQVQHQLESVVSALGLACSTSLDSSGSSGWYVPINCCWADALRSQLQLSPKDFHITVGFLGADYHGQPTAYGSNSNNSSNRFSLDGILIWSQSAAVVAAATVIAKELRAPSLSSKLVDSRDIIDKYVLYLQAISYHMMQLLPPLVTAATTITTTTNAVATTTTATADITVLRCLKDIAKSFLQYKQSCCIYKPTTAAAGMCFHRDIGHHLLAAGVPFGLKLLVTGAAVDKCTDFREFERILPQPVDMSYMQTVTADRFDINQQHQQQQQQQQQVTFDRILREVNQLVMQHSTAPAWTAKTHRVFSFDPQQQLLCTAALPRNFSWVRLPTAHHHHSSSRNNSNNSNNSNTNSDRTTKNSIGNSSDSRRGDFLLAGCAFPTEQQQLLALHAVGIRHIITVHEFPLLPTSNNNCNNINSSNNNNRNSNNSINRSNSKSSSSSGNTADTRSVEKCAAFSKAAAVADSVNVNSSITQQQLDSLGMTAHFFRVPDRTPPTLQQTTAMCDIIQQAVQQQQQQQQQQQEQQGVVVHCQGGVGRTNTVLIAYLIRAYGGFSAADAIAAVTQQRKIILAESQKGFLRRWWEHCNEQRSKAEDNSPLTSFEPTIVAKTTAAANHSPAAMLFTPVQLDYSSYGKKASSVLKLPPLLLLCGLPAAGKSCFARTLVAACPQFFFRINKDEMRSKGQCEDALYDALHFSNSSSYGSRSAATTARRNSSSNSNISSSKGDNSSSGSHRCIVIDCCNITASKRSEWLSLAHQPRSWCIYFNTAAAECKRRIQLREGHPTIPTGQSGIKIIDSMLRQLQEPTQKEEGSFERVIEIQQPSEALQLLAQWGIVPTSAAETAATTSTTTTTTISIAAEEEVKSTDGSKLLACATTTAVDTDMDCDSLLKFPRTAHILNLGAATRDDKILASGDLQRIFSSSREVIIEEKLDGANLGLFIRKSDLCIVAQNRSHFVSSSYHPQFAPLDQWIARHAQQLWQLLIPGRHVLYGEWLFATHSVQYSQLPGWFVAYDLYDRSTGKFASRDQLTSLLAETSIPQVPVIFRGAVRNIEQLLALVDGPSAFNDAKREGFVLRLMTQPQQQQQQRQQQPHQYEDESLELRAKLVRSDFIAGNERWNRSSTLATNQLAQR